MNKLSYDIINKIYDFVDWKYEHKNLYKKNMFEMQKRPWSEFRKYFIEQYIEFEKDDSYQGLCYIHFFIWDEYPERNIPITYKALWRPAFVNTAILFGGYNEDGFPAHSIIHVPGYKNFYCYDLSYTRNVYWKPIYLP